MMHGSADLAGQEPDSVEENLHQNPSSPKEPFFIVGVGASAGGLEALVQMFTCVPEKTGMAFVVVQHLSPDFKSLMDQLLARHTSMPIHRVEDGMPVEPDSLYLIPPKKEMIISGGRLLLMDKDPSQALTLPIDHFLRSLAQDAGRRSIAVVLSGTGSDGSRGVRDINEAGGLVIVQEPESAKFDGMPRNAIETGVADVIAEPEKVAEVLRKYSAHRESVIDSADSADHANETNLEKIFRLLQERHKIDFNHYKPSTIGRRIERRIQLRHAGNLDAYVDVLHSDPTELDRLYKDLLIGVTSFFRDPDAFDALQFETLPTLLMRASPDEEFRVWVAGCATGEEAYSVAIAIREQLDELQRPIEVKIFATDAHRASLDFASQGVYPESQLANLSPVRRKRFFTKVDGGYQIVPEIRKMIVFAPHNLVKDAPFTRLNLISCRNLLIYLRQLTQKKVLSLFHFSLQAGGVLFLGSSETPGDIAGEFSTLNDRWKLYQKQRDNVLPADMRSSITAKPRRTVLGGGLLSGGKLSLPDTELLSTYDELLDIYMPPGLLINENREVLQMFGGAGRFLRLGDGRMSSSVLDLVEGDLKLALAGAIQRVARDEKTVSFGRVRVQSPAGEEDVHLEIQPIRRRGIGLKILISFRDAASREADTAEPPTKIDISQLNEEQVHELEKELRYTKENLQATIEELETSNEELQAANEEMVASNEELQSTNEELHSVNEELYTVNAEYQKKINELTELTNDMDNLLVSTKVHTIFLDADLCIRKFTPQMAEAFNLLPYDIGRRIDGFTHNIQCEGLTDKLQSVLSTGDVYEEETRDHQDADFLLRILPYYTESQITGVVLTLIDIASLKQAEANFRSAVEASPNAIVIADQSGKIVLVNPQANLLLGFDSDQLLDKEVRCLLPQRFHQAFDQLCHTAGALPSTFAEEHSRIFAQRRDGSEFPAEITVTSFQNARGQFLLTAISDLTLRESANRQLAAAHAVARTLVQSDSFAEATPKLLKVIADELRVQVAEMWRYDPNNGRLGCVDVYTDLESDTAKIVHDLAMKATARIGESLVGQAWEAREPVLFSDLHTEQRFTRRATANAAGLGAGIAFPIVVNNEAIACVVLFARQTLPAQNGIYSALEGIGQDIAQFVMRKQAEDALRRSEARFELAAQGTTDGVWEWEILSGKVYYTQRFLDLLGYAEGDLTADIESFNDLLHSEDSEQTWAAFHSHLDTGEPYDVEMRLRTKSGIFRWFRARGLAERSDSGKPIRMAGSISDIDERKRWELQARREINRRDRFLAMLSHELRNPMSAVLNAVAVLNADSDLSSNQDEDSAGEACDVVQRQTLHMGRLLDDLLDVSRITQNKIEYRKEVFDVADIVEEVVQCVEHQINAKDQRLMVEVNGPPLHVYGDPARMKQTQVNLLANAAAYTPEGGSISYELRREDDEVVISVTDDGRGIPEEMLERIFDLFVQHDASLERSAGGMGLGLSLSRSIVQAHGGTLVASSDGLGTGSQFVIRVPLSDKAAVEPVSLGEMSFDGTRLLLVEDNLDARTMLVKTLRRMGFEVIEAGDGQQALEQFERVSPEVAVIDIGLPGMNGYQVAEAIRDRHPDNEVLLIALTGYGRASDRESAKEAGFDAHLVKPLNPERLLATISEQLQTKKAAKA